MGLAADEIVGLLAERKRRQKLATFTPDNILTVKQHEFYKDPSRFKLALCGRRAGKTTVCGWDLLQTARSTKDANCAYVTGTRRMAKNIMWPILVKLNIEYGLGFVPNHTDLTMVHLKTGGRIQLSGANNVLEVDKLRGQAWHKVNIDEAQSLGRTLKGLINEVITPALVDHNGVLLLTGTPGPVPSGPFYEAWLQGWSVHEWTMGDNPYLLKGRLFESIVAEEAERRGVETNDPSIQREFLGRWIQDLDALVIRLDEQNYYDELPGQMDAHVCGGDIGYDDADAWCALGWQWTSVKKATYLVEEEVNRKHHALDALDRAQDFFDRYSPIMFAMDTAGPGKKIAKVFEARGLPVTAFDKSEKTGRAYILRAAALRGELKVKRGGPFDEDCKMLCWEYDEHGRRRISEKAINDRAFHSDIFDSVLGAYIESLAHRAQEPPPELSKVDKMREERRVARKKRDAPTDLFAGVAAEDALFNNEDEEPGGLW